MKTQYIKLFPFLLFLIFSACKGNKNLSKENNPVQDTISINDENDKAFSAELLKLKENRIAQYKPSRTRDFDLIHTDLNLSFDYEKEWVFGEALLTLKPYFYTQNQLVLDAKDFDIHSIKLINGVEEIELNYRYDTQKLRAYLPKNFTSNDTLKVAIKYTAKPNENPKSGSEAITDTKGLYFINSSGEGDKPIQIWTQGETEHNSKWFPTLDTPNERATQEIKLTVDRKFRTISNGELLDSKENDNGTRTDHWNMNLPHAPYLAAVIVGDFVEIMDSWEDIQVNYYVEETFAEGAKTVFKNTPEMIGFFSKLLGVRYPWQKYDQVVVRDFVSGAMENTTISVFMEELNLTEREAIDSEWDGIIAHELFHQWFGNYVTTESWANLTLNEAFANYSEYLWYEYKEGLDDADLHHISEMEQYFDEATEKQVDLIRFYHEDSEEMFDSHSYAKGGRILHMLRKNIGDEAFFKALNLYLTTHAYSSVEAHDLRLAFEKVTGMDLNWFFDQWFFASGHPILEYEVDYSERTNLLLTVSQNQNLQTTPLYKIPFKVSWYVDGERFEKEFLLDQGRQQFAIENANPVYALYFDEKLELLAEKKSARGAEHFLRQFERSQFGISRYEALDSLGTSFTDHEEYPKIVSAAIKDSFWSIRELALLQIARNPDLIMQIKGLEEILYAMAENDEQHTVRTGAVELLSSIDPDKYSSSFLRWMNHPSYYVAGAALSAYLESENNLNRSEIAQRFEEEDNIRIVVALADYFITENQDSQSNWFHNKLKSMSGQSLYYFLGYYGDYFAKNQIEEESNIAVENLYEIGLKSQANYIRAAAFQSLFGFVDEEGVLEKIKELYEKETDADAKRYKEYYLSPYLEKN
ncbi:aminopeptidase N [Belliella baltica DSM 15883]|uniref:Aminopeptidase N n=1 Tax=Belliella baltica (strain DSM 15883 / CIP 108006 / LMG 21964 / BA134) TaxID=866536 RepID=I3Z4X8_BELBD|nr:M1 family metallopeptidase [Belliella baltica]AFL84296.1 aminopeptidase N [Belliella baltica DSM 15883]